MQLRIPLERAACTGVRPSWNSHCATVSEALSRSVSNPFPLSEVSTGEDQLIVVLHGLEDTLSVLIRMRIGMLGFQSLQDEVVPVDVAREQWQMLGSYGYRGAA